MQFSRLLGVKESPQIHVGYHYAGEYSTVFQAAAQRIMCRPNMSTRETMEHLTKRPVVIFFNCCNTLTIRTLTILRLACCINP